MLVRVSQTRSGGLPNVFDEDEARHHPEIRQQEWGEFVVAWIGSSLELWEDYVSRLDDQYYVVPLTR
jgi:hypothetical protein